MIVVFRARSSNGMLICIDILYILHSSEIASPVDRCVNNHISTTYVRIEVSVDSLGGLLTGIVSAARWR